MTSVTAVPTLCNIIYILIGNVQKFRCFLYDYLCYHWFNTNELKWENRYLHSPTRIAFIASAYLKTKLASVVVGWLLIVLQSNLFLFSPSCWIRWCVPGETTHTAAGVPFQGLSRWTVMWWMLALAAWLQAGFKTSAKGVWNPAARIRGSAAGVRSSAALTRSSAAEVRGFDARVRAMVRSGEEDGAVLGAGKVIGCSSIAPGAGVGCSGVALAAVIYTISLYHRGHQRCGRDCMSGCNIWLCEWSNSKAWDSL